MHGKFAEDRWTSHTRAGGLGKTRLMIEVAETLRNVGWIAGFLDRPHEDMEATLRQRWQAIEWLILHGEYEGLLIVMDYAEGRRAEVRRIATCLNSRPENDKRPLRLVLLARSPGEWWRALYDESAEVQRVFCHTSTNPDVIAFPAIATGLQRGKLFDNCLKAFTPWLVAQGYVIPRRKPSRSHRKKIKEDAGYARPLAIQMEALLWLASAAPKAGTGVEALLRRVLGLEREHWKKLIGPLDEIGMRDMARAVAGVTLGQGVLSFDSVERLLMADSYYKGQRLARVAVDPVIRNLYRVYGNTDGGLTPLEPDLIGEHHIALVADNELIEGCLRWITTEPVDTREKRRRDLLTILQRATQLEHGIEANNRVVSLLDHLIQTRSRNLASDMGAVNGNDSWGDAGMLFSTRR